MVLDIELGVNEVLYLLFVPGSLSSSSREVALVTLVEVRGPTATKFGVESLRTPLFRSLVQPLPVDQEISNRQLHLRVLYSYTAV
jgi:hypothetical protein